jgi:hypothetical protein
MTVVAVEPARAAGAPRPQGFAALEAPRQGFAAVRTVVASPFAAVN